MEGKMKRTRRFIIRICLQDLESWLRLLALALQIILLLREIVYP